MDLAVDTSEGAATRESSTVAEDQQARPMSNGGTPRRVKTETPSSKYPSATQSPAVKGEREETIGGSCLRCGLIVPALRLDLLVAKGFSMVLEADFGCWSGSALLGLW